MLFLHVFFLVRMQRRLALARTVGDAARFRLLAAEWVALQPARLQPPIARYARALALDVEGKPPRESLEVLRAVDFSKLKASSLPLIGHAYVWFASLAGDVDAARARLAALRAPPLTRLSADGYYRAKAVFLVASGAREEAVALLRRVIGVGPKDRCIPHVLLGEALRGLGREGEARVAFEAALRPGGAARWRRHAERALETPTYRLADEPLVVG